MIVAGAVGTALVATAPSFYLGALTALAVRPRDIGPNERIESDGQTRFAICIPAHNEQFTIGETVAALLAQKYPATKFSVHVVADNCTDSTAAVATRSGATAHVRSDAENPGKGEALNWLIDRVAGDGVDAIAIVDADTVADPGFLAALDREFRGGARAVQGFYAVKDPDASAAVGLRYAAIACRHYLRPLARTRLGASSGLYGNGMAFRTDVLAGRRWSNHLIEDAEFQMELLLDGQIVRFAPDAVVRAEMPVTLEGATSQNERWELGRAQLIRRYVPVLARRSVTGGTLSRRAYGDAVADHLTPPLTLLAVIDTTAVALGAVAALSHPGRLSRFAAALGVASSVALGLHVLVGLRLVDAPPSVYRSLRSAPRAVLWKLMLLARVARRPADVAWTRTQRNQPAGADDDR
jgi:cellulose synthase/poly-beta-1,6-N-acetylglucosamine synthase-like glycosyltransferase